MAARGVPPARLWLFAAAALALVLWALGDIVLPFVLGAGLAYLLNPLVEGLARWGLPRAAAVALIAALTLLGLGLAVLLLIPMLITEGAALIAAAPALFSALAGAVAERFPELSIDNASIRQMLAQAGAWAQAQSGELLNRVLTSARSMLSVVLLLVIVPVVTVYLLLDWPRVIQAVDRLLPRPQAPRIRAILAEIDRTVAAFVRGMGSVCLLMGAWYGIGLMLVGLQFGLVVGVVAGLLTFIPYVGALVGGAMALGLGLYQFWGDWLSLGLVAAVFFSGQMLEGNVITPRVLGQAVGLHPVWLLFALSMFGALFGLVGMLVAVPVAAAVGVLVRHGIDAYLRSDAYLGPAAARLLNPDHTDAP